MTTGLNGGVMVLVPRGHLHEGNECDALEREITIGFARGGTSLVVDFSQTDHLSARALGILAQAHLETRARGGQLSLRGVKPDHRLALDVAGLLGVIEVQDLQARTTPNIARVA